MNNSLTRNLLICTFLWIVFLVLTDNWLEKLLLLAIFLAIPLLLFLVPTNKRDHTASRYHTYLMKYHPYIAATAGLSFVFPPGLLSGILSIPWSLYLFALAGYGVRRLVERGWYIVEENAIDIGFLYGIIAGIWFCSYAFGFQIATYPPKIVLLTAVHFHFAGIFAPTFMGFVGRKLTIDQKAGALYRWTAIGMMASPLIVAIGIATTQIINILGGLLFASCLCIYSYFVLLHTSKEIKRLWIRLCLQVSALVVVLTILLAIGYSIGNWLTIDQMVTIHGTANAIGFVFLGLLGWVYLLPKENAMLYGLPRVSIYGEKRIGKDFFERKGMVWQNQQHAGLIDNLEKYSRGDFFIAEIHPKIRSFYENTVLYDLASHITWHKGFNFLAKLHKLCSSKMEQIDFPLHSDVVKTAAKIIAIRGDKQNRTNLRAWVRSNQETDKTMFVAVYTEYQEEHETFLHITLPIPRANITGILRLEHGTNQSLQITSLPRRGPKGDEGVYLMLKKFSIRLPINEHFLIWVDEYGRLQATHRIWLFGFKIITIEYEISGKTR